MTGAKRKRRFSDGQPRRGTTLIEVSVSILLVGAMGSILVQALVSRAAQQRSIDHRELAAAEAANLMEQLTALPWDELTGERVAALALSDDLRRAIPAAKLAVTLEPSADKPEAKRINIQIDYPGVGRQAVRPIRLAAWVYRLTPGPAAKPADAAPADAGEDKQS